VNTRATNPINAADGAFELKGSRFSLSVIRLHDFNLDAIDAQLTSTIARAPGFLNNAPVVIDVSELDEVFAQNLEGLIELLRQHHLLPVGMHGHAQAWQTQARSLGLPLMSQGGTPMPPSRTGSSAPPVAPSSPPSAHAQIVERPVRSGQQIYAKNRDLVVLGAVSPGAEIIADGSIHVYGALRGRALAGACGDEAARIFCQSMEAELLSIAGCYRLFEQADPLYHGCPAHAHLKEERLIVDPL